jgi:hypothetical protein
MPTPPDSPRRIRWLRRHEHGVANGTLNASETDSHVLKVAAMQVHRVCHARSKKTDHNPSAMIGLCAAVINSR